MTVPSPEQIRDAAFGLIARLEAADLALPHIVLVIDPVSGARTAHGPHQDAAAAAQAAAELSKEWLEQIGPPAPRIEFVVHVA